MPPDPLSSQSTVRSQAYALRITLKAFLAALLRRPGGAEAVVRREVERARADLWVLEHRALEDQLRKAGYLR